MESVENDEGKVVLVTGGARGIGYAISKVFYSNGYTVVISDLDEDAAKSAILEIDPNKKRTFAIKLDVASSESVDRGIAQIKDKYGKLNVLINNAGNFRQAPSATYSDEDWEFVTGVHLDGTFRCVRAAYPLLKQNTNSSIVSISSITARIGLPKRLSYVVSKAGIEALTRVLAVEWAPDGIRVNAVAPGFTLTQSMDDAVKKGITSPEKLIAAIPLRRLAVPKEIAEAVYFLSSSKASYITGQTLIVDGGATIDIRI
jgi:NAD(P)-dependent dehydrogenase (short-subunit alcohol dehydrogenase family)